MASVFSTAAPGGGGLIGGMLSAGAHAIDPIIIAAEKAYQTARPAILKYGGAGQFLSEMYGAVSARRSAEYHAQSFEANAQAAEIHATQEANRHRLAAARQMGQTRAAFGASGLAMSGSPIEVLAGQAGQLAEDEFLIRQGGQLKARGYGLQASAYRASGRGLFVGKTIDAFGTLLTRLPDMKDAIKAGQAENEAKLSGGSANFRVSSMLV